MGFIFIVVVTAQKMVSNLAFSLWSYRTHNLSSGLGPTPTVLAVKLGLSNRHTCNYSLYDKIDMNVIETTASWFMVVKHRHAYATPLARSVSAVCTKQNKKLSYCWETVRRESMPSIAEMDVEMTT